jgi:hypothetical protein
MGPSDVRSGAHVGRASIEPRGSMTAGADASIAEDVPASRTLSGALTRFWTEDLPPLTGPLRIIVYGALLALAIMAPTVSPLGAPDVVQYTIPEVYAPQGIAQLYSGLLSVGALKAMRIAFAASWVCCIVGLFGGWSRTLLAILAVVLHGAVVGGIGQNHVWYIPTYTFIALAFASADDWSLDRLIRKRWPSWRFGLGNALTRTGFARKLVVLFAVHTLFSGGLAKLISSGPVWMDGATIHWETQALSAHRWEGLASFLLRTPWLFGVMATFTMVLELVSPLALFSTVARRIIFATAIVFHIGIFFLMLPWYWPQMACYTLVFDWGRMRDAVRRRWLRRGETASGAEAIADGAGAPAASPLSRGRILASYAATCAALGLFLVAALRVEFWPVTHVPMYSAHPAGYSLDAIRDDDQARHIARECLRSKGKANTGGCVVSPAWFAVNVSGPEREPKPLGKVLKWVPPTPFALPPHIAVQMQRAVWGDIAESTGPLTDLKSHGAPRTQRLLELLAVPARKLVPAEYDRVDIALRVGTDTVPLASTTLGE